MAPFLDSCPTFTVHVLALLAGAGLARKTARMRALRIARAALPLLNRLVMCILLLSREGLVGSMSAAQLRSPAAQEGRRFRWFPEISLVWRIGDHVVC
jgi:hypothetical protein